MFRLIAALLGAAMMAFMGAACSEPLTADECNQLLRRYVQLLIRSDRPDATTEDLLLYQQRAQRTAAGDAEFARCPAEVSRSQFQCAMEAPNVDELEQCLLL